jgi:hypothetical protein
MDTWLIARKIIWTLNNTNCSQGSGISSESVVKKILDAEIIAAKQNALPTYGELLASDIYTTPENLPAPVVRLDPLVNDTCEWSIEDDDTNSWQSGCGHTFWFETGDPKENGLKFCAYCGRNLTSRALDAAESGKNTALPYKKGIY